jgi:hypothetical protein
VYAYGVKLTEPAINRARGSNSGKAKLLPTKIAKERVIQAIKDGLQVEDAMALVDRSRHTYIEWRRSMSRLSGDRPAAGTGVGCAPP